MFGGWSHKDRKKSVFWGLLHSCIYDTCSEGSYVL